MSFSVFSCRTIINSPRRGGGKERDTHGTDVERLPRSPSFCPLRRPTGGQAILVTGPRGASAPPRPRPLVDGNTSSAHVIRKQKPVGKLEGGGEQPHCSCSKSSSSSHHWKLSRELFRGLPPPPSRRSIGKAVSVSHTAPLL